MVFKYINGIANQDCQLKKLLKENIYIRGSVKENHTSFIRDDPAGRTGTRELQRRGSVNGSILL